MFYTKNAKQNSSTFQRRLRPSTWPHCLNCQTYAFALTLGPDFNNDKTHCIERRKQETHFGKQGSKTSVIKYLCTCEVGCQIMISKKIAIKLRMKYLNFQVLFSVKYKIQWLLNDSNEIQRLIKMVAEIQELLKTA